MANDNDAVAETNDKLGSAITEGFITAMQGLDGGWTLGLLRNRETALRLRSPIPYRYEGADSFSKKFLLAADPCMTGLASTMVVNQILEQLETEGYGVERTPLRVTISPKKFAP